MILIRYYNIIDEIVERPFKVVHFNYSPHIYLNEKKLFKKRTVVKVNAQRQDVGPRGLTYLLPLRSSVPNVKGEIKETKWQRTPIGKTKRNVYNKNKKKLNN